ncbi:MAG: PIG-L family deacetylase [Alicyclobacillaceae bacterium]|nr:PIG-L family deacetylase [Alicyclobacillaceae bacterium]
MSDNRQTLLVISAHSADFVWRAGGAIALYSKRGYRARVLCLSYGERGESASMWKAGKTLAEIKAKRREEAERAADILGAEIRFFDQGDYPLRPTAELIDELVDEFRTYQPVAVLTHSLVDPYNMDHVRATELTLESRVLAQAHGYPGKPDVIDAPPVFLFEPHQPEQCEFKVHFLLDITEVFEQKRRAMECMGAQEYLWEYYTDLAKRRGLQCKRNGGPKTCVYAEAYQRVYPQTGREFV